MSFKSSSLSSLHFVLADSFKSCSFYYSFTTLLVLYSILLFIYLIREIYYFLLNNNFKCNYKYKKVISSIINHKRTNSIWIVGLLFIKGQLKPRISVAIFSSNNTRSQNQSKLMCDWRKSTHTWIPLKYIYIIKNVCDCNYQMLIKIRFCVFRFFFNYYLLIESNLNLVRKYL